MQRDGLQPLVGLAQARAQEVDGRHRHLGIGFDQLQQRLLRQGHSLDPGDRSGPRGALTPVEGGDLAEDAAAGGVIQ